MNHLDKENIPTNEHGCSIFPSIRPVGINVNILFLVVILLSLSFLSGCSLNMKPQLESFESIGRVYNSKESFNAPKEVLTHSSVSKVYRASYADVFRTVNMSASLVLFNVESADEDKGIILATREPGDPDPRKFFHAFIVKEVGRKKTKVTVLSKVQSKCSDFSGGSRVFYAIGTFGVTEAIRPAAELKCDDRIKVRWITSIKDSSSKEIGQLFTLVRGNLMAQGLM